MILKFVIGRPLLWPIIIFYVSYVPLTTLGYKQISLDWVTIVALAFVMGVKKVEWSEANLETNFDIKVSKIVFIFIVTIVSISLLSIPFDEFRITRDSNRQYNILFELIDLHLISAWIASVWCFSDRKKNGYLISLILIGFCLSFAVAIFEARRTSAVLPIAFLIFNGLLSNRRNGPKLLYVFSGLIIFFLAFWIITSLRVATPSSNAYEAILVRVFWPSLVLQDILSYNQAFDPQILSQLISRIEDIFIGGSYLSRTGEFGRAFGYISTSTYGVGINYGILGELYLQGSYLGIFIGLLVLNSTFIICVHFSKHAPFKLGLLLPVLYLHGFQLEYPYTLIVLIKITIVLQVMQLVKRAIESVSRKAIKD